jgi:hypothetical protein
MNEVIVRYEVVPLRGVGPVIFGMTRLESREAMRQPFVSYRKTTGSTAMTDAYHQSSFQVYFDVDDRVEYIELSRFPVQALYKGVSVLELKAEEVVSLLTKDGQSDDSNPEQGYSYIFPDLELSVWRPTLPEEDQDENDSGGMYFETIGIGKRGYYSQTPT